METLRKGYSNLKTSVLAMVVSLIALTGNAMAALPTEASDAFTALSSNVTDIVAAVWPILAASVGAFVLFKLFRKGMNKI